MLIKVPRLTQRNLILFLLPVLTVPTVSVVGELMLSDIAVAILAPLLFFSRSVKFNQPYMKEILWLLALWLCGVVISDIVNDNTKENFLRGAAAVIFFGLHLFVFFVLIDAKRERVIVAVVGSAVALLVKWGAASEGLYNESLTATPWKMGGGFSVTILFLVFLGMVGMEERGKGKLLIFLSPIHLLLNARSLFLTTALAGLASVFQMRVASQKARKGLLLGALVSVFIVLPSATTIYGSLTEAGVFGDEARTKYLQQTAGGQVNIILAGRSESLVSFNAISDKPILGHGSWPESYYYYLMYLINLEALGQEPSWEEFEQMDGFLIPTHSILFGSWVSHGVLGALFWFFILYITLKAIGFVVGTKTLSKLKTVELLVLFALLWDILFSPFGQDRRCIEAIYIIAACLIVYQGKRSKVILGE